MTFQIGDRVRFTDAYRESLRRAGYYSEREDGHDGTIRAVLTSRVFDVKFDGSQLAGGRITHGDNIEHA